MTRRKPYLQPWTDIVEEYTKEPLLGASSNGGSLPGGQSGETFGDGQSDDSNDSNWMF
jgi:hypothetical protein